jgi:pyridine nucleotide-disulfide oxidoreductase
VAGVKARARVRVERGREGRLGTDVKVAKFPFTANGNGNGNGKAHGLGDPVGFVKIVSDDTHGELPGAHLIGPEVTELLPELTLAQQWDLTVHEVTFNNRRVPEARIDAALMRCRRRERSPRQRPGGRGSAGRDGFGGVSAAVRYWPRRTSTAPCRWSLKYSFVA